MLGIDTQMGKLLQYVSDWEIFGLKRITTITFSLSSHFSHLGYSTMYLVTKLLFKISNILAKNIFT